MNFERLLLKAKEGNADAVLKILEIYKPLLIKNAIVNGRFDEDLYQELEVHCFSVSRDSR